MSRRNDQVEGTGADGSIAGPFVPDHDGELCIIGQPSGPRSWSEYWTHEDGVFDTVEQFHRRNPTLLPTDLPHPTSGPHGNGH